KDKKWLTLPASMKVTTFMGGLYVYSGRHIYQYENNILWICSEGSGLLWYDYLHNRFGTVETVNKISLFVRHLLAEGDIFWLPTDNGLIIYDWKRDKIIKHVVVDENGSNVCYAIQKDDKGYYWISTNSGIFKINQNYQILQRYNTGNGLPFLEYNTACVLKDSNGVLHFGGMGGITYFNPSELRDNSYSPMPLITGIRVNDKNWPLKSSANLATQLKLDHTQNFLTIDFAVNNFSNETNNLFSYRLKGLNDNWSAPSSGNVASFTSVPPGDYVFELKSANSDGKWTGNIKSLAIFVQPAFWQTRWFQALAVLLIVVLVYFFTRRRIKAIRQEAMLKQHLAELEIKGLHAQMNPHFIFNCLNSIKEMILNDQKQNASRYLSKFANLIRTGLDHSRQTFITVEQCVDHLKQYLEMEKLRFEDFSYQVVVDESLQGEDTRIAPMLVQPLVENAIWHGLRNKENDRSLVVRFFKEKNQLICEIEDNGVGMRHTLNTKAASIATHRSLGIANIQERLTVLNEKYNMKCSLKITDKADLPARESGGTLAVLQLTI
ncbi:MAG TPA: histidine kinase, partial [Chitinophagaceae bacterium]|nr:histidine kinase [Chitinophagaceae bacterium]